MDVPEDKKLELFDVFERNASILFSKAEVILPKKIKEMFKSLARNAFLFLSKPKVYRTILLLWHKMNRVNLKVYQYKKYVLCNSMESVIPIPILEETYLIMDTDFAISKLDGNFDVDGEYKFYRVVPPKSIWEEVEISVILDEAPPSVQEDILFRGMGHFR